MERDCSSSWSIQLDQESTDKLALLVSIDEMIRLGAYSELIVIFGWSLCFEKRNFKIHLKYLKKVLIWAC